MTSRTKSGIARGSFQDLREISPILAELLRTLTEPHHKAPIRVK
ncbi:hypothetical protein SPLC1_S500790 [Arthrospira platensis C1]|nr:hypothetical protein SPLC1_S500790 [Arthrospira platensis C1]